MLKGFSLMCAEEVFIVLRWHTGLGQFWDTNLVWLTKPLTNHLCSAFIEENIFFFLQNITFFLPYISTGGCKNSLEMLLVPIIFCRVFLSHLQRVYCHQHY